MASFKRNRKQQPQKHGEISGVKSHAENFLFDWLLIFKKPIRKQAFSVLVFQRTNQRPALKYSRIEVLLSDWLSGIQRTNKRACLNLKPNALLRRQSMYTFTFVSFLKIFRNSESSVLVVGIQTIIAWKDIGIGILGHQERY